MTENTLKAELVFQARERMKRFIIFAHQDKFTGAIPDLSFNTDINWSAWIEIKFADPEFDSPLNQQMNMWKLSQLGYARYVIYCAAPLKDEVLIVHPGNIHRWNTHAEERYDGHNHQAIIDRLLQVHSEAIKK